MGFRGRRVLSPRVQQVLPNKHAQRAVVIGGSLLGAGLAFVTDFVSLGVVPVAAGVGTRAFVRAASRGRDDAAYAGLTVGALVLLGQFLAAMVLFLPWVLGF